MVYVHAQLCTVVHEPVLLYSVESDRKLNLAKVANLVFILSTDRSLSVHDYTRSYTMVF